MSTFVLVHGAWHDGAPGNQLSSNLKAKVRRRSLPPSPAMEKQPTRRLATRSALSPLLITSLEMGTLTSSYWDTVLAALSSPR